MGRLQVVLSHYAPVRTREATEHQDRLVDREADRLAMPAAPSSAGGAPDDATQSRRVRGPARRPVPGRPLMSGPSLALDAVPALADWPPADAAAWTAARNPRAGTVQPKPAGVVAATYDMYADGLWRLPLASPKRGPARPGRDAG